jgi:hypothetical protein
MEKSKKEFLKLNIVLTVVFSVYSLGIFFIVLFDERQTNVFLISFLIFVFVVSTYFLVKNFKKLVEV